MPGDPTPMFHDGHRSLQDRFDGRRMADALAERRRFATFRPQDIALIEGAEFFFLATAHGPSVDCSFKGGPPGFVRVTGPARLEWSDLDGNSMYRSLGNVLRSPRVGLLFIRFGPRPERLRVNGTCSLRDGPAETGHRTIATVEADQIFPNCPRCIPDLTRQAPSPWLPDDTGVGPRPDWKDAEDLRDALPADDPHRD